MARAEEWPWSSLHDLGRSRGGAMLSDWPIPRPPDWAEVVNRPRTEAESRELEAQRTAAERGRPYGDAAWVRCTADALGLAYTLRGRGRPAKEAGK